MDAEKRAAIAISGLILTGAAALTLGAATPASAHVDPASQAVTPASGYGYGDEVEFARNFQINQQNLGVDNENKAKGQKAKAD